MKAPIRESSGSPVRPSNGVLQPLGISDVTIIGGYWAQRRNVNRLRSIPHCLEWETSVGSIDNFAKAAAGVDAGGRAGREFSDSDVYKLIEAMAWQSACAFDSLLEGQISKLASQIAAAQQPDGYLNTHFGQPGQPGRYTDFEWGHELYCYGHLFQAAVARLAAGQDDTLVGVARRAADHVCDEFGDDGRVAICGHPEVEAGLAELGRALGRADYIEQARLFIARRGNGLLAPIEWGQEYFQDDQPVRDATVFRGHAVRAGYLASGAIDVAIETGDSQLLSAVRAQYDRTLARRTYITGGMGSRHTGESFGDDFELPPDRAYCETCAAIGSVMVAWRLLLATGDESYADVIERTLYNAIAASPSESGDAFFYANPLQVRTPTREPGPREVCLRAESGSRAAWFTVPCCPPNVARMLASLPAYVATTEGNRLRLHQFTPGEIVARRPGGDELRLSVATEYPNDGRVTVTVVTATGDWSLALRVPGWASVKLTGLRRDGRLAVADGRCKPGDVFVMDIDMEPRLTYPDPRIDAVRGCVAVERGPLVLCLESANSSDGPIGDFRLDSTVTPTALGDGAFVAGRSVSPPDEGWPYLGGVPKSEGKAVAAQLIPYHRWGNRGPSAMRVWLPLA